MPTARELYGKPWSKNEYLIVLSAYFQTRDKGNAAIERAIHDIALAIGRTNRSVGMRFANFQSIDPELRQLRKGLSHVDQRCRMYFADWSDRQELLHELATALRSDLDGSDASLFSDRPVRIPFAFRKYELGDLIGDGAFGAVYSCVDTKTDEPRAIKILRLDRIEDTAAVHRFRREIKILRTLSHPNVIALYEDNLDEEERFPAFVMDLAECSLPQYLHDTRRDDSTKERPVLPTDAAIAILSDVMRGVIALHEHNPPIVHRDINPNNILRMPDGRWVVADFTLSKFAAAGSTYVTATTTRGWGTTYYAAPEQWRDFKSADHRCDIHALGALAWDLFTSGWPPPHEANLLLPAPLDRVVRQAMAREPSHRFPTVRALREALAEPFGRIQAGVLVRMP